MQHKRSWEELFLESKISLSARKIVHAKISLNEIYSATYR